MNRSVKTKLLLIDRDKTIGKILRAYLEEKNYDIVEAENGEMGFRLFLSLHPEIIVTNIDLPDRDGLELIKNIRQLTDVALVACSAVDDDSKVVAAINNGADDYIARPFNPEVLMARINGILRRFINHSQNVVEECLSNGAIKINLFKHQITIKDKLVFFSPKQYNLLKFFMVNKGKILTHREILGEVWGKGYMGEIQYLRVHIGNIREKIKAILNNYEPIHTEPGIGYRMEIL